MIEQTIPIVFNNSELLLIDDGLTLMYSESHVTINTIRKQQGSDCIAAPYGFIRRLSHAVVQSCGSGADALVRMDLTESELLAIREVIRSTTKVNEEEIGRGIKIKVHHSLASFHGEEMNSDQGADFDTFLRELDEWF